MNPLLLLTHCWTLLVPAGGERNWEKKTQEGLQISHIYSSFFLSCFLLSFEGQIVWWWDLLQQQQICGNTGPQKLCSTHIQDLQGPSQIPKIKQNLGFISFTWLHPCLPGLCSAAAAEEQLHTWKNKADVQRRIIFHRIQTHFRERRNLIEVLNQYSFFSPSEVILVPGNHTGTYWHLQGNSIGGLVMETVIETSQQATWREDNLPPRLHLC